MDNESQQLWATASMSLMGALKYTTHLLPLLHSLRFIINARNKCVTVAWVVINENDDPMLFFDSSNKFINKMLQ